MKDQGDVPFKLTILSGNRRGQTLTVSNSLFRLGAADDCDLTLEGEREVEPHHAEIVQENCDLYLRKTSQEGRLLVNRQEVTELILQDQDLIGLGFSGPQIRLRIPPEKYLRCKPIFEICRDCIDMVKLADLPPHRKVGVLMRQMGYDLVHQTTRLFKLVTLGVLLALASAAGSYVWWSQRQFHRYESALARLGEQAEKERRTLAAQLQKLQASARQAASQEEQRQERLKNSLGEKSGVQLRHLEKELQNLRREFDFAPPVVARYSGGVCFIVGGYGFVEKASGKMLRFAVDSQGEPLKDSSGRVRLEVGDQGVPLSRSYTGSGFLVTHEGHILTNRHVAEPWADDEAGQQIIQSGFDPTWLVFRAYFPGEQAGYSLTGLKHSDTADVSLLKTEFGKSHPPVLSLSQAKPRLGEPILLLGYPAGYDAMLARYSQQTINSVISERPTGPEQLAQALAHRNLIRPIATQGHLGDVLSDRLVYDAQTTYGGSGGPILNARGEVIGINFAILQGFGGSNFGVPVELVRPLLPR